MPPARDARFAALPAVSFHALEAGGTRAALRLYEADGTLSRRALSALSHLCRDFRRGAEVPMAPRALQLVYKAAVHFGGAQAQIVSGYRAPSRRGGTSHHAV